MKLTLDFIPLTGEDSLYNFLKRTRRLGKWKAIKEYLIRKQGRKCQACNQDDSYLEAHEVWEYDEIICIQSLKEVQLICKKCHLVKHLNFFYGSKVVKRGMLPSTITKQELITHFCQVNECTEADYHRLEGEAFQLLRWRNKIRWKKDFGTHYKDLLDKISDT